MKTAREVHAESRSPSPDGCGSCINCIERSGAPCRLGQGVPKYPSHPGLGRVISGRDLPKASTPFEIEQLTRSEAVTERDWQSLAAADEGFEPCRDDRCPEIGLHRRHERPRSHTP